jgi:hypothetical protein
MRRSVAMLALGCAIGFCVAQHAEVRRRMPGTQYAGYVGHARRARHVQDIADRLSRKAGLVGPVRVNESYAVIGAYIDREAINGSTVIVMDPFAVVFASEAMLEGIIAHEVGHAAAGHLALDWNGLTYDEKQRCQREADAYGMRIIGDDAWRAYRRGLGLNDGEVEK